MNQTTAIAPAPIAPEAEHLDDDLWRQAYGRRLDRLAEQQEEMQGQLEENTAATERIETSTTELVEMLRSWKGAMAVLETLGKIARPIGYIAAAAAAVWGFFHLGGGK